MFRFTAFGSLSLVTLTAISFHLGLHAFQLDNFYLLWLGPASTDQLVLFSLRIPRTLLAIVVGSSLALAGVLMQTATRNALAEPGLTGVNSGAAAGVVIAMLSFGSLNQLALSSAAILGSMASVALIFGLSALVNMGRSTFLLTGAAIGALANALTQTAMMIDERTMEELLFWLAGGFAERPIDWLPSLVICFSIVLFLSLRHQNGLDLMLTDDRQANAIGLPIKRYRFLLLLSAALLAGLAVSLSGPVGFVGLLAPHMARWLGTTLHKELLVLAPMLGANITVLADIVARYLLSPAEAPITAMIALVGSPLLVLFFLKRSSQQI